MRVDLLHDEGSGICGAGVGVVGRLCFQPIQEIGQEDLIDVERTAR